MNRNVLSAAKPARYAGLQLLLLLWLATGLWLAPTLPARGGFFYAGTSPVNLPWPGGTVPFVFDTNLSFAQRQTYLDGIREWELAANVHFIPRTNQSHYILFKYDPNGGDFVDGSANPVVVGVSLLTRAQLCHETGHALGFTHEHIRPDRDHYVLVLTNNITPGNLFWFDIDPTGVTNGVYDFESVMHFPRDLFSMQPGLLDTLQARPGFERFQPRMDNYALSPGDRAALRFLYGAGPVLTNIVSTTADAGPGSLRAAIYYATDHPGTSIRFNIPNTDSGFSNGVFTIYLTGDLPALVTDNTRIDATTQPGFSNHPLVVLSGSKILPEAGSPSGFLIYAASTSIKGLAINGFPFCGVNFSLPDATNNMVQGCFIGTDAYGTNGVPNQYQGITSSGGAHNNVIGGTTNGTRNVVSGNAQYGVLWPDALAYGNVIQGNYLGLNAAGTAPLPNGKSGIGIFAGASNNVVGGASPQARNVLSGNREYGMIIIGANANGNVVQGNFIGTDFSGLASITNGFGGLGIWGGASSNQIGGSVSNAGNLISGNVSYGIFLGDAGTSGNAIQGNLIGTDANGHLQLPNSFTGIGIYNGVSGTLIGGTNSTARNIISGNSTYGIVIQNSPGNAIQGNYIGTDSTGAAATPNGFTGIGLYGGARNNVIGGTSLGARNLISGNNGYGLVLQDAGTMATLVQGNLIGGASDGVHLLPNAYSGVEVSGGATTNTIGLDLAGTGASNVILGNGGDGISVDGANTTGNTIRGNNIYGNTALGLNLVGGVEDFRGVTANHVGGQLAGPNHLQNLPVLTSAATYPGATVVRGTLNSGPGRSYLIDLSWNPAADPSGYGEGQFYLGSSIMATDANGDGSFAFMANTNLLGKFLTATATDAATGDTSEFSRAIAATNGPPQFIGGLMGGANGLQFSVMLQTNLSYRIQAATNLGVSPIFWTDLTNFTAAVSPVQFIDQSATNHSSRFYRVVSP